jgi:hypothetical protein
MDLGVTQAAHDGPGQAGGGRPLAGCGEAVYPVREPVGDAAGGKCRGRDAPQTSFQANESERLRPHARQYQEIRAIEEVVNPGPGEPAGKLDPEARVAFHQASCFAPPRVQLRTIARKDHVKRPVQGSPHHRQRLEQKVAALQAIHAPDKRQGQRL